MEGKRLAMKILTVLLSVCTHLPSFCAHQLSLLWQNRARKLKQDLQNIWRPLQSCWTSEGTMLFWSTVLTPLSDNTDSGFCLPSRSVYAGGSSSNIMAPNHLWGHWAKAPLPAPLCIFKICRGCTNYRGGRCNQVLVSVSAALPIFNLWYPKITRISWYTQVIMILTLDFKLHLRPTSCSVCLWPARWRKDGCQTWWGGDEQAIN